MSNTQPINGTRRIYGRGFFDGLRAAGKDPEDFVNARQLRRAEDGLTGIAKTILDAVPIAHAWNANQIVSELKRVGRQIEHKAVLGCLDSLRGQGLIKEPERGLFMRVVLKPKETKMDIGSVSVLKVPDIQKEQTPLDILASISERLRTLADDIDASAIKISEQFDARSGDTKKLQQLQQILKSIGA